MAQSGLDLPEKDYYFRTDQKSVEREELVKQAFPQLGRICENRGVSWGEVDLRWGITDEASAEGKVLPLRLSEIQRCGWFIGLLGDRYGWVPEEIPLELLEAQPGLHEHRGDLPPFRSGSVLRLAVIAPSDAEADSLSTIQRLLKRSRPLRSYRRHSSAHPCPDRRSRISQRAPLPH
jgi:hypothetical protein